MNLDDLMEKLRKEDGFIMVYQIIPKICQKVKLEIKFIGILNLLRKLLKKLCESLFQINYAIY
ncbi:unnamed protein product [marine sediment metagenome]|uniref:Uncharacterized protein n=1 Tax=marine sediment metagenome TaxID=412755 RepID=X1FL12_9ZZZZ